MNPLQAQQAKQAQPAPPAEEGIIQQEQNGSGEEPATPEEQAAFDNVEMIVMKILYDDATHKQVMKSLQNGQGSEADVIANTSMMLFLEADKVMGGKVPEAVVIQGAANALKQIVQLAQESGAMQITEEIIGQAIQKLMLLIGKEYEIDPEEMQQLIAEMDEASLQEVQQSQSQIAQTGQAQPEAAPPQEQTNGESPPITG